MNSPITIADLIVLILFGLGFIFLYVGFNTDNLIFIIIGIIEFILAIIQIVLNKNPILFE